MGIDHNRLGFLDRSFLHLETPTSPMHIAGLATFDAGPLKKSDGGIDIDKIRDYVASRLHLIPRYRQRLAYVPLENRPVWVDDEHFNIHYHLRHIALPKPGNARQLKQLAARVMAQQLDRQKPLWEIWILEGLTDPSRFVMITKVHHCMVDGLASVVLLNILLKPEPSDGCDPAPRWIPRRGPSGWALLSDAVGRYARLPVDVARGVPRFLREVAGAGFGVCERFRVLRKSLGKGTSGVSNTPLNRPIGPHRRLDWLTMDLEDVKGVKNRLGGTVNDVVLATVAGALRRYLLRRGMDVTPLDVRIMAPVSIRVDEGHDTLGNQISAWIVPMPLGERDPLRRLDAIREVTEHLKESPPVLHTALLSGVVEWTPTSLLAFGARFAVRVLPFNLVVTNVPGPQQALYMLGGQMVDNFGFIPLVDSLCLGVVLFSYAGKLCWGFTAEWDLLPDLDDFVGDVAASFRELCDVPAVQAA